MIPRTDNETSPAWYALRRTLPTWSLRENLDELVRCLPEWRIDEVIVKVDTEEFTHGQVPLDWVRDYQPRLHEIRAALEEIGVVYSLNPWITVGHCDRGRDSRADLPGLRTIVGHDGTECTCCACPLEETWRAHTAEAWSLYAETRPAVIWVEDDIRTFNHRPVEFGCFCPTHLARFAERIGREISREQLVTALLAPGEPDPLREAWLDFQAETMIDTARFLQQTVHAVSPATRLGLMSSGPRNHCLEGRQWSDFAAALAGDPPLLSRPPLGNYSESSLRGLYHSADTIQLTRHVLPPETIEQSEVENVPFTRYANSVRFTFLKAAVSFATGCDGVTMNLFDHCGTPMSDEPWYGEVLSRRKPMLNTLATLARQPGSFRGARLLHHERSSYARRLPDNADYPNLAEDGERTVHALNGLGVPTTYDASGVTVATGQTLRAFDDETIRDLLAGGLFLDAVAAAVLAERGFAGQIGLAGLESPVHLDSLGAFSAEEVHHPDFGGEGVYLTLTVPDLGGRPNVAQLSPSESATTLSSLVDPDARRLLPGMIRCENDLGGRVVVHALDWRAAGVAFLHPHRQRQLHAAVRWLARDKPPALLDGDGVYPLGLAKDCGPDATLLAAFNLSLDPWTELRWQLAEDRTPETLHRLDPAGQWQNDETITVEHSAGLLTVTARTELPFDQPLFLRLTWR